MTLKINQMLSLKIETLLANGYTREELVTHLKNGTLPSKMQVGDATVDFSLLIEFAKTNWDECEQAIRNGYQVTFHTVGGVKSLLAAKFGLQAGRDYQDHETHFDGVPLPASGVEWLKSMLAVNWLVREMDQAQDAAVKTVQIALAPPQNA